jgi:hypothetical protein
VAAELEKACGQPVPYESTKIKYTKPETTHTYTPDFVLPSGIVVETKGRLMVADRQKHLLIKAQHPSLDIRFVFSRSAAPIRKGSKTTYGDWATKHGFIYADKSVPKAWLK